MKSQKKIERKWLMAPDILKLVDESRPHTAATICYFGKYSRLAAVRHNHNTDIEVAYMTIDVPSEYTNVECIFTYGIDAGDAIQMTKAFPTIHMMNQDLPNGFIVSVFRDRLEGLILLKKEYADQDAADQDDIPDDWFGVEVTGIPTFDEFNLIGKMWDPSVGLLVDPGPARQFGGDPFPPMVEYQIITGDEEDFMPPPLIIP